MSCQCEDNLRTKEQLGYSVFSMMRYTFGVLGFSITVNTQVDKFSVFSMMRYTFGVLGFSITVNTQVDKFRYVLMFVVVDVLPVRR
ncbi:hypothetical protein PYW07_008517 [Mythimna separata]|uniref:Uncharacterized protein n=1 Tax=Mythimna separata TaxID=271217 RepID=A0AAD8DNS1_MYTSE|nr:hypothetical protein PYW07_008514 [Mythimna separata]KAJ8711273.1 hypothetical protein PYW07_008515 [Mythimna separata]KAJ8711274.1 hypothetical protein PYW07_008516 [Mythimna separata]KAJ8711275.1 hypothetical protein PYW07_008517 [Mythimna separata]